MNLRNKCCLFLLSVSCVFTACKKDRNITPVAGPAPFAVYTNVLYATDTLMQTMDVYLPAGRDSLHTPVVILIHGGAWYKGDKADFAGLGLDTFFNAKGYAVINMNYRLDTKYQYPSPIFDVGLVMDYIKQKAAVWKINPDRVCLLGRSSGAQLAMMYAYHSNKDGRIKMVIDGFGPADLTDSTIAYSSLGTSVSDLLGDYALNKQSWHDASPVYYASTAVPTFIFQGTADSTVYFKQSAMLQDSLQAHGVPCRLVVWDGYGHGWAQNKWVEAREATYSWMHDFL